MKEKQAAHVAFVQTTLSSPQVATGSVNPANQAIKQHMPSKTDVCTGEKKLVQNKSERNSNFPKKIVHIPQACHDVNFSAALELMFIKLSVPKLIQ